MTVTAHLSDNHKASAAPANNGLQGTGLADGLLPVAFSFRRRRVRLLQLSGVECREPNFRQTVERWAADNPDLAPVEMTWSAFIAAARQTPLPAPAGFVFNVARCGSTLLANMLAAPSGHTVLKESSTLTAILCRIVAAANEAERQELVELLTVALPLFGRTADLPSALARPRLFVKPHSWVTVAADTLLRLFPETPGVFLYRAPWAVVASMLAKAPYGGLCGLPREEIMDAFPSLAGAPSDLTPAAFHAHLWRSPVEAALALAPDALLLIDYAELVRSPTAVIARMNRHFGIAPSPETVAQMTGVMRVYAKDASRRLPFDAAGTHRRPPLNAAQHDDVSGVVGDLYARLEARRQSQT